MFVLSSWNQNLGIALENCTESAIKLSIKGLYFLWRAVWENKLHFLNRSRLLGITNFGISKAFVKKIFLKSVLYESILFALSVFIIFVLCFFCSMVMEPGFPLVGGIGGRISPPTSQNFDKSPLTKILSLLINVPLHLVWHPLPSISQSPL